jgi:hypothetical protein
MRFLGLRGCSCRRLPAIFKIEDQGRFVSQLEEVDNRADWLQLYRCTDCGQHWQLDLPDKYQVSCAIKIEDPAHWQSFDDKPVRLQFLIESRGGLSQEECAKAGCSNRALKSLAFCPAHAYEIGIRV